MILPPQLNDLFTARPDIGRFVNLQMQGDINHRWVSVIEYLERARNLLELLLQASAQCDKHTFRSMLPKMSALAHGVIDHMHIASNITNSLLKLSADDIEYPSGRKIGGPYQLKELNPTLWSSMDEACSALADAAKDLKGIRDTAHHVDERLNGMAGKKRIVRNQAIMIGCFNRGEDQTLTMESTAVLPNSATTTTILGYLARVELSPLTLKKHAQQIRQVFSTLPWAAPLPELISL